MKAKLLSLFIIIASLTKQSQAQIITTVCGNRTCGFSGDGGQAILAELCSPSDVNIDHLGNIYISDNSNNLIRKVNTNGIISTVAGDTTWYKYIF
jgi:hypothetical protein